MKNEIQLVNLMLERVFELKDILILFEFQEKMELILENE